MSEETDLGRFLAIHEKIRGRFPQAEKDICGNRRIHLNCAAGTLVVDSAARAMEQAATWTNSLAGDVYPAEAATKEFIQDVRTIAADFLNAGDPDEISFHFSTTHALFNLAYAMRDLLGAGTNIIITDLDHMANVSPWEEIGGRLGGCEVRRAGVAAPGRLDLDHLLSLLDKKTALVAVTMASNGLGTVVPLEGLVRRAKEMSPFCLICVDAVHHALHGPIDVQKIGCDFLAFSGYKVFGPMLGVLWGRKTLLEKFRPYRVETNRNLTPYKYEQGTLNTAALASLAEALRYLLWLSDELDRSREPGTKRRRTKFKQAMTAIASYERELSRVVLEGFRDFAEAKFFCFGITDVNGRFGRDPTFAFELAGRSARETKKYLWDRHAIQVADGNHYSAAFLRHFRRESVCRASFAHYNSIEEAKTFLAALRELAAGA